MAAAVAEAKNERYAREKRRYRIVSAVTAVVMAAVLIVALVYFNFIDGRESPTPPTTDTGAVTDTDTGGEATKPLPPVGNAVGNLAPDVTLSTYNTEDDFTLSDHRGKVTVINFWGTWCAPCIAELPYFDAVARDYADQVTVVAVHTNYVLTGTNAPTVWIPQNYPDTNIVFAQDTDDGVSGVFCTQMGGSDVFPMTIILDEDGVITFVRQGSLTRAELESAVKAAMGE